MSGSTEHLDLITEAQAQKATTSNTLHSAASPAMLYARRAKYCVGLVWAYYGGVVFVSGVPTAIANGTLTLTASTTCYVRKLDSTGAVSFVTSIPASWPAASGGYTPLYTVVVGSASITSWTDHRVGVAAFTTNPAPADAAYLVGYANASLANAMVLTAGAGITLTEGGGSPPTTLTVAAVGGGSAPADATYVVLSASASLSNEAVLVAGSGITLTEGGGSPPTNVTIATSAAKVIQLSCSDLTTALTVGTGKAYFRMPYAMTLTGVRASLLTASGGSPTTPLTIDINEGGSTILSTKLTIDDGEKTSTTAAVAAVISDSALADDAEITVDIDGVGAGAMGLIVTLIGT